MPFAPLLGTNHHKQTIIFGAALLLNKTIPSFIWLFEIFFTAMGSNHPSTIFTDQNAAMAGAITYVFPNTSHRLCLRHIYLNASKHLSHESTLRSLNLILKDVSMKIDRRCFKKKWNELLTEYNH
jgi:zinc finger SWIM domain-containing protein 3